MDELIRRLSEQGLSVYSDEELSVMIRRTVVMALKDARFSDAFPDPYLHEISALATQAVAEGSNQIVIQLVTEDRGLASFLYDITTTPTGISVGPASQWFVPKNSSDRKIPKSFDGVPRMAIDVSVVN